MRENPIVKMLRGKEFGALEDPLNPGRIAVAESSRKNGVNLERTVAVTEIKQDLTVLSVLFSRSPMPMEEWRRDFDNGTLTKLADTGGYDGKRYYCARIEPQESLPKELASSTPTALLRMMKKHSEAAKQAAAGSWRNQLKVQDALLRELRALWLEALMHRSARETARPGMAGSGNAADPRTPASLTAGPHDSEAP